MRTQRLLAAMIAIALLPGCLQILGDYQDVCDAAAANFESCNIPPPSCVGTSDCRLECIANADCHDLAAIKNGGMDTSPRFNGCIAKCLAMGQ